MERKRTISEDAVLKTQHLLINIHHRILNKQFPFSIHNVAKEAHISSRTVSAMFNLKLFKRIEGRYSGKYEWLHTGEIDRLLAVQVMNQALDDKADEKSNAGEASGAASDDIQAERLKRFKTPVMPSKQPSLFAAEDEKRNHAIQLAAGIAAGAYKETVIFQNESGLVYIQANDDEINAINSFIAKSTQDLLTKIYNIKF